MDLNSYGGFQIGDPCRIKLNQPFGLSIEDRDWDKYLRWNFWRVLGFVEPERHFKCGRGARIALILVVLGKHTQHRRSFEPFFGDYYWEIDHLGVLGSRCDAGGKNQRSPIAFFPEGLEKIEDPAGGSPRNRIRV